jgi:indolepyruvate ferredoxin oxidoreductase beta subunit
MGRAVKENVKEKYQEMNHKALELGKAAFEQI